MGELARNLERQAMDKVMDESATTTLDQATMGPVQPNVGPSTTGVLAAPSFHSTAGSTDAITGQQWGTCEVPRDTAGASASTPDPQLR